MPERELTTWLIELYRDRVWGLLKSIAPGRWDEPGPDGGWSLKDLLGHFTLWNEVCCDMLLPVVQGGEPKPWPVDSAEALNRMNDADILKRRARPTEAVGREFEESVRRVLARVDELPDTAFAPDSEPAKVILFNTYGHWGEHMAQLRRLVREPRTPGGP